MFQIVICHKQQILQISWKYINLSYHNVANRHAAAPRWDTAKPFSEAWNSVTD